MHGIKQRRYLRVSEKIMTNKIVSVIGNIAMFFVFNGICRYNACYFPKSLFKKYIIIKNEVVKRLLIGESVGRDKIVDYYDSNKLSIVGLMAYLTLGIANFLKLFLKIMIIFDYKGLGKLESIYVNVDNVFAALLVLYFILLFINDFIFWDK